MGGVKLFDPTQFQATHLQPQQPATQGDAAQQQQHHHHQHQQQQQQHPSPNANAGAYYNAEPQPGGQASTWDNWGHWNWNTDGQNAPLSGDPTQQGQVQGQAHDSMVGEGGVPAGQHPQGQHLQGQHPQGQHPQGQHPQGQAGGDQQFVGQQQQQEEAPPPMGQFYNPQQYQNGSVAPDAGQNPAGGPEEQQAATATSEYPGWAWDPIQGQWAPTATGGQGLDEGQRQGLPGLGQDTGGQQQYFYQGQQAYYDPAAWNSTDPSQSCQWGNSSGIADPHQAQPGRVAGPEETGGQSPQQAVGGGQEPQSVAGDFRPPEAGGVPTGSPESNQSAGDSFFSGGGSRVTALPPVDTSSGQPPFPAASEAHVGQGHVRESSMDSNASGTVAGFFGRGDDEEPFQQQHLPAAAPDAAAVQHLKVAPLQRTDSGISNASLQTVNTSADEDTRDAVEEVTAQMGSLELKPGQMSEPAQHGGALPPQLYAPPPGDFSGFGNYNSGLQGAAAVQEVAAADPSASRESEQRSPVLNDWEIVPPQAHSSTSHSRNDSLDDGINFSAKLPASGGDPRTGGGNPQAAAASMEVNPVATRSGSTQDSESFTAISSTSSASEDMQGSAPFSQASSHHPSASSTPFTSPGAQSVLSQPSSIPSWQGSPRKATAADSSPSPVLPPPPPSSAPPEAEKGQRAVEGGSIGSTPSVQSSPERAVAGSPRKAKYSPDKSLYESAVSGRSADSSKPFSPKEGGAGSGSGSGRPPPSPSPRGSGSGAGAGQDKEGGGQVSSPSRRHHSAFHPVHSQRAKHNMSPATTLWDNLDTAPTANILLAPAAPLIIPSLGGGNPAQSGAATAVTTATSTATSTSAAQPSTLRKSSSNSSSLEKLSGREGGRKGREREGGRYGGAGRRSGERSNLSKGEELSRSRDEDNRSLGSLDELDATPDFTDDPR